MKTLRTKSWTWERSIDSPASPFTSVQKHVALTLSKYMSSAGDSCYPKMETLASDGSRSVSTVRDALRQMSEWGWLDREIVHGRGRSNQYLAVVPDYFDRHQTADENRRRAVLFATLGTQVVSEQSESDPAEENRRSPAVSSSEQNRRAETRKPPERSGKTAGDRHQVVQDRTKDHPAAEHLSQRAVAQLVESDDLKTAAASESEPVSIERAVARLATLEGWDTGSLAIVMPLAQQLPAIEFERMLAKLLARRAVKNPPGLLVHLLRVARDDWRKTQNDARLATWDEFFGEAGLERVKREDPDRYVTAWATPALDGARPLPAALVNQHVLGYVFEHTSDEAERIRLLTVYVRAQEHAGTIRTASAAIREWILVAVDRERLPLSEVLPAIDTLTTGNPEARDELISFAREVAANVERDRKEQAA